MRMKQLENQKTINVSLPFFLLMAVLQTVTTLIPGVILLDSKKGTTIPIFSFIVYLLLCELFQYFVRLANKNGTSIATQVFIIKLIISCFFIFSISSKTVVPYGVILACYELFQFLCYSRKFNYMHSFLYLITNSFFKGIVFNQLFIIYYPFNFTLDMMKPFIFSFLVILLYTALLQGFYSSLTGYYLFLSTLLLLSTYGFLVYSFLSHQINLIQIFLILACNLFFFIQFGKTINPKKKEFILSLFILSMLCIFYI